MLLSALFLVSLYSYSLISQKVENTPLTPAILFCTAGTCAALGVPSLGDVEIERGVLLKIAEVGLATLLFTDAARTDLAVLCKTKSLPVRLLSVGMLLTLSLGTACAMFLLPQLTIWEAAILSAILAPTDAGLGQAVATSPRVPSLVREALNVEAGLNDGMAVPFLLCFIGLAAPAANEERHLLSIAWEQLGLGVVIGLALGGTGGYLLGAAARKDWAAKSLRQLALVTVPLLCIVAAENVAASMFIAAFVAGLAVQWGFRDAAKSSIDFTEEWGQLLNFFVFFFFGLILVRWLPSLSSKEVLYALLSLTVVRMLPVAVALAGSGLCLSSVLFMGWFGPRGLASIVLGLVFLEQQVRLPGEGIIRSAVIATVLLSISGHGLTTVAGIRLYERRLSKLSPEAPELQAIG